MLLQLYKSVFILAIVKEVEAHEARSYFTLMKNSEINNNQNN